MSIEKERGFIPCPTCKQYSHSIREDWLGEAVLHFTTMHAHPVRGHPMGDVFDAKTQDYAQRLVARVAELEHQVDSITESSSRAAVGREHLEDAYERQERRITELEAEIARLRTRLEIPDPPFDNESCDGISCRDDTIQLLDARIAALLKEQTNG